MKTIFSILKLTLASFLLLAVIYPLAMYGVAQLAPNHGKGEILELHGKTVGYRRIGQNFNQNNYFWGRPSAVNYNAAGSAGSNKGSSNADYLKQVQKRIDTFLIAHPYLKKSEIPSDMVTASGSGLDPDISIQGAKIQIKRIAKARNIDESKLQKLVETQIEKPVFGPEKINVLALNIALNKLQ